MSLAQDIDETFDAGGGPSLLKAAPDTVSFKKLRKRLVRQVRQALDDFSMVGGGAGERWLLCLSGGKDSYALLAILSDLKWRGLLPIDLLACNLDQGQPGFPKHVLPDFLSAHGLAHRIEYRDTYSIVTEKVPDGATYCALCSRLRRANLYRIAREEGCSAIVLGHHREDILETFFLNLMYAGRLEAMPPKLRNDEGDLQVLRPTGLLCRGRHCKVFCRARVSDHPVRPVRLAGWAETEPDEADVGRYGTASAGAQGYHAEGAGQREAGPLAGPQIVQFFRCLAGFSGWMNQPVSVAQDAVKRAVRQHRSQLRHGASQTVQWWPQQSQTRQR
jgi:tRNA 2-thiocytidine biosynthesis protein TtcA